MSYGAIRTFGYKTSGLESTRVPVGLICSFCGELIEAHHRGVWMFMVRGFEPDSGHYFAPQHEECQVRSITGTATHQRRMKQGLPCGPECHAEEGFTGRESALAAYYEYHGVRVHILEFGFPLCRFSSELPGSWPARNKWTSVMESRLASCDECKTVLAKRIS